MQRLRVRRERRPQLDVGRIREAFRHYPHHGVLPPAERQLTPYHARVGAEPAAPIGVGQHDDPLLTQRLLVSMERPPELRPRPEHAEEARRDAYPARPLRFGLVGEVERGIAKDGDLLECPGTLTPI